MGCIENVTSVSPSGACPLKRRLRAVKKTVPAFRTDTETHDYVHTADLTEYELSGGTQVQLEFKSK